MKLPKGKPVKLSEIIERMKKGEKFKTNIIGADWIKEQERKKKDAK